MNVFCPDNVLQCSHSSRAFKHFEGFVLGVIFREFQFLKVPFEMQAASRMLKLSPDVDLAYVATKTENYTGVKYSCSILALLCANVFFLLWQADLQAILSSASLAVKNYALNFHLWFAVSILLYPNRLFTKSSTWSWRPRPAALQAMIFKIGMSLKLFETPPSHCPTRIETNLFAFTTNSFLRSKRGAILIPVERCEQL